ncbi:MAG TPA: MarR family transcriptional regulator [Thermomonospora sp.]|nr:MarR family transcriptional regulator [Thermomonospora sp.]
MTTTAETTATSGLAGALVRVSALVQQVFADVSREHDVTPQQAQLLCKLLDGSLGMTELSRLMNLEKSSLTGLVDRVERRGLVTRVRDLHDRRACKVGLTCDGARLAAQAHAAVTERLDAVTGELADADRQRLAAILTDLLSRPGNG